MITQQQIDDAREKGRWAVWNCSGVGSGDGVVTWEALDRLIAFERAEAVVEVCCYGDECEYCVALQAAITAILEAK